MSNKKQHHIVEANKMVTAVEWLARHLYDKIQDNEELFTNSLIQAKEMDKKQRIKDMSKMQIIDDVDYDGNVTFIFNNIEQYYKETYE